MEKSLLSHILITSIIFLLLACKSDRPFSADKEGFQSFLVQYEKIFEPFMTAHNQAQWDAYTTGKKAFFDKATEISLKMDSVYQNRHDFEYLKELRDSEILSDPELKRQLEILYLTYLTRQIDPGLNKKITELSSKIEGIFANFRTEVEGEKFSDNQVTKILQTELNSDRRESLWRAQKALGDQVSPILIELAGLRNKAARQLGFDTFYHLKMTASELDPDRVESVFDQLQQLTDEPFATLHEKIEAVFEKRYKIDKSKIRPWHYEDLFGQSAPAIFDINLDTYYQNQDIPALARKYYASAGISVDDILARSDLYEREGKSQHAFSFFIDRKQDIRILCNIVANERWMETMLHELGHAIYDKYLDPSLPFLLREPAHPFTTEGIAMFFGSYSSNANWMQKALNISPSEKKKIEAVTQANLRLSKIIFARWSMVLLNFEKSFYADPGQDLNKRWWDLVEKFQKIKRPEIPVGNEWATKLHIATYPVYYQNYQLGELLASQILNHVAETYYQNASLDQVTFWDNPQAGNYLKERVFKPGKRLSWNEMIEKATGKELSAEFFVEQYIQTK